MARRSLTHYNKKKGVGSNNVSVSLSDKELTDLNILSYNSNLSKSEIIRMGIKIVMEKYSKDKT